jgi:hypothetical protein
MSDAPAAIQRLRIILEFETATFYQADRQAGVDQLLGDADTRSAAAYDAKIGLQGAMVGKLTQVADH